MRRTGTRACATSTAPAPPQLTTGTRAGPLIGVLADPRIRLGIGTAALLVTALAVRRDRVSPGEARVFRAVNGLTDAVHAPAWVPCTRPPGQSCNWAPSVPPRLSRVPWNFGGGPVIVMPLSDPHSGLRCR